jgi:hypothetical protein
MRSKNIYEKNLKLFTAFLKLNNAYERYFINLRNSRRKNDFFEVIISYTNIAIDRTLVWRDTNEGWEFWNDINDKCNDFFRKFKQQNP